ncbi:transport and Golgi organization 2 homolog [Asparagus officinalis]|nr:transport and Golgi organization 2 homolog [Asparagus officinalis]XP_020261006.1 transport and Golgi organization 2 homolog [Asparagus officinalis]
MCIAAWIWQSHPAHQLLLFLNRDEYHDRATEAVGWWGEGNKKILGGRDVKGGGTWLGCTKDGRVAFLTNAREPESIPDARTRGVLPLRFLESTKSPHEFAEEIVQEADYYNGFNLILADLCSKTMVYVSNRPKGESVSVQTVPPGLHVLSNAQLDTPWPKAQRLHDNFSHLLKKHGDEEVTAEEVIEKLMMDKTKADMDELPITGCDPDWEFNLSSIFVETDTKRGRYGTRSTAAFSAKVNGEVTFYERYLERGMWKEHKIQYQMENGTKA